MQVCSGCNQCLYCRDVSPSNCSEDRQVVPSSCTVRIRFRSAYSSKMTDSESIILIADDNGEISGCPNSLGSRVCTTPGDPRVSSSWNKIRDNTGYNFLPAWNDRSDTWSTGPMTTAQASLFLKEYLEPYIGTDEAERFSSHSCKPTLLTWAGMTDILKREERTLMCHHVKASTRSATTYNRDALLIVHSKLVHILDLIKKGELKPDASRAEKLTMLIGGQAQEDAESHESDYEETDPQPEYAEVLQHERPGLPQESVDEFQYVTQKLTGTVHVVQSHEDDKLACGRRLTVNMSEVKFDQLDAATATFCIQCNAVVKAKS